ncbi:hypothetical protein Q7P37_009958 [Cladosporium fusiforme]
MSHRSQQGPPQTAERHDVAQPQPESYDNGPSAENLEGLTHTQQEQAGRDEGFVDNAISDVDQDWSVNPPVEELSDHQVGSEDLLGQEQLRSLEHNRSDSESHVSFQSEHSSLLSEDSEDDEMSLDSLNAALYIACSYALPRVVHFLITKGANPNLLSPFGLAAFHMAVRSRPPWNHFERVTMLHTGRSREVWHGLLYRTASVILKFGGDPNLRSKVSRLHDNCGHDCWRSPDCGQPGQTTLHLAFAGGIDTVVALLLESGANVELRDEVGYLPVYYAMAQGHCDVTLRLLRECTDPTTIIVVQRSQSTALHVAARFGSTTAAATLLGIGADANILDAYGITPHEEATRQKNSDLRDNVEAVLNLLLRHGARVERTQSPCSLKHNRLQYNLSDSIYESIFVPTLNLKGTSSIDRDRFTQVNAQQQLMTSFPPINDEPQMANSRISEPTDSPWFDEHKRTELFGGGAMNPEQHSVNIWNGSI